MNKSIYLTAKERVLQNEKNHQNDDVISINSSCDLSCVFCNPDKNVNLLDTELLELIKQSIQKKKQNILSIGGAGEPLMYPYIDKIFEEFKKQKKFIILKTTGVSVFEKIKLLKKYKHLIKKIIIPVYGPTAKIHDSITNTSGSFDIIMNSIEMLLNLGIKIEYSTVILKQNYRCLKEIISLINDKSRGTFKVLSINWLQPDPSVQTYEECAVKFKDCVPYLKEIPSSNINLCEIPPCFFKEKPEYVIHNNGFNAARPKIKIQEKCATCRYDLECKGIYKEYVELFGISELDPILIKKQDY